MIISMTRQGKEIEKKNKGKTCESKGILINAR